MTDKQATKIHRLYLGTYFVIKGILSAVIWQSWQTFCRNSPNFLDSCNFHKKTSLHPLLTLVVVCLCGLWSPLKAQDIDSSSIKTDSSKTVAPASKPFQSPIRYEAKDSIVLQMKSGKANLYKEAAVNTDNMELKARYIEVGLSNKLLFARGGQDSAGTYTDLPIFKDGADQYVSDSLSYNSGTKKGKVYGLTLTQDEAHIQLKQVVKQPDGSFMGPPSLLPKHQ